MDSQSPLSWLIIMALVALVIYRNIRAQRLTLARIWVAPVLLGVLTLFSVWGTAQTAPAPLWMTVLALAIGIALGAPLGFARGRHSRVRLAETPGVVIIDPSLAVMLIWGAAFAFKFSLRAFLPHAGALSTAGSDGFIVLAVTSVIVSRWIIFIKARDLESAQAAGAG